MSAVLGYPRHLWPLETPYNIHTGHADDWDIDATAEKEEIKATTVQGISNEARSERQLATPQHSASQVQPNDPWVQSDQQNPLEHPRSCTRSPTGDTQNASKSIKAGPNSTSAALFVPKFVHHEGSPTDSDLAPRTESTRTQTDARIPENPTHAPSHAALTRGRRRPCNIMYNCQELLERRRERNRVAATKCREKGLKRQREMEDRARLLQAANTRLLLTLRDLRDEQLLLKAQIMKQRWDPWECSRQHLIMHPLQPVDSAGSSCQGHGPGSWSDSSAGSSSKSGEVDINEEADNGGQQAPEQLSATPGPTNTTFDPTDLDVSQPRNGPLLSNLADDLSGHYQKDYLGFTSIFWDSLHTTD